MAKKSFNLDECIQKYAEHPALIAPRTNLTFTRYLQCIKITAGLFIKCGLKKGDRVAIISHNSPEFIIALMASWLIGVLPVPISIRWPLAKVESVLKNVNCQSVLLSRHLQTSFSLHFSAAYVLEDHVCFQPAVVEKSDYDNIDLQQPATILLTSGSSGDEKAVLHHFSHHYYNALGSNENIIFKPGDAWLLSLPLYHVGGLAVLFRALLGGGAIVVPDTSIPFKETILDMPFTHVSLVATQLYRLLEQKKVVDRLKKLKAILLGGSAIPHSLIRDSYQQGLKIFCSYGSTEMASQITTTRAHEKIDKLTTSGKRLRYRKLKIAENGEILVKGDTLFAGYLQGKKIVKEVDALGWFSTGDIGYLDEMNYLTVQGRLDNRLISGGENIQPEEIERVLNAFPEIKQCLVVPISHKEFGQRPVVFLDIVKSGPIDTDKYVKYLEKHLPRYKIPDYFFRWPENSDSQGMKVDRTHFKRLAEKLVRI